MQLAPQYSAACDSACRCSNALSRCSMSASSRYFAAISKPARAAPKRVAAGVSVARQRHQRLDELQAAGRQGRRGPLHQLRTEGFELALELWVGQAPLHGAAADARLLGGLLLGRAAGQRRQQYVVIPLALGLCHDGVTGRSAARVLNRVERV